MSSVGEGEEAYFDTTDYLLFEEESSDYDIWSREPLSVEERRKNFLYKMGFSECSISGETEVVEIERVGDELSSGAIDDSLLSERRRSNSEANCSVDYSSLDMEEVTISDEQCEMKRFAASVISKKRKNVVRWWRSLSHKLKKNHAPHVSKDSKSVSTRVEQNRKRWMECSAVYGGQVVKAHDGLIWTMKFSPDGQFLASGGEDGLVCIWRLTMVDSGCCNACDDMEDESASRPNKSKCASIVIPDKVLRIGDAPLQRLKGHRGDVLDLAWSSSNHLLSSSTDETVRLWRADSDECLAVFHHSNYVTCVQFNPVDESHFISGCIDGKVRIWSIFSQRVEEWGDMQDVVTAVSYQPNGRGFVVGSLSGLCRFYELSDTELILYAEINIQGRKKSSGNKITGIQFVKNDSQRVMITSEDSKIRILDGLEVVQKYKGLAKSGSQMSASFTSSGRHIVSIGDDSRVYLWNYYDPSIQTSKQAKSSRSCESFVSEGATVVLNWSDSVSGDKSFDCSSPSSVFELSPRMWESGRFSLANWFSMDASSRGSATWPEEKLPLSATDHDSCGDHVQFHQQQQQQHMSNRGGWRLSSTAWGLVFVTANRDGTIRMFHNYGLPVRA